MKLKKKFIAGALAAGLAMGAGGIAAAYFTATGTGNGSGSVGHPSTWKVTVANNTSGDITPGGATETIGFTVTNVSSGHQFLHKVTVSIPPFSHETNTNEPACTENTFELTGSTALTQVRPVTTNEPSGASYSGQVTLILKTSGATQNNCQGWTIPISVHAT